MLAQAASTTAVLFLASLLCKLCYEGAESSPSSAAELLREALHWRDVAAQDTDPAMRLQHAASAAAMLNAARMVAKDVVLERASQLDVPKLAKTLESDVAEARKAVPSKVA